MRVLWGKGVSPICFGGWAMGSGVVPRDTLSLSVYLPIAIQRLLGGLSPNFVGRGGVRRSSVVPRESPSQWTYFVYGYRYAISHRLGAWRIVSSGVGWGDSQIEGRGGTRGSKLVPLESVISVSYWLPIDLTKALSLTVFAEPSNVTDRQNWYSNIQTSCCVRWRACIGRWKLFTYLKADIMFQIFCESATTKITILLSARLSTAS